MIGSQSSILSSNLLLDYWIGSNTTDNLHITCYPFNCLFLRYAVFVCVQGGGVGGQPHAWHMTLFHYQVLYAAVFHICRSTTCLLYDSFFFAKHIILPYSVHFLISIYNLKFPWTLKCMMHDLKSSMVKCLSCTGTDIVAHLIHLKTQIHRPKYKNTSLFSQFHVLV